MEWVEWVVNIENNSFHGLMHVMYQLNTDILTKSSVGDRADLIIEGRNH